MPAIRWALWKSSRIICPSRRCRKASMSSPLRAQPRRTGYEGLEGSLRTVPFSGKRTRHKCPDNKKGRHAQGAETLLAIAHCIGGEPLPGLVRQPRLGSAEVHLCPARTATFSIAEGICAG